MTKRVNKISENKILELLQKYKDECERDYKEYGIMLNATVIIDSIMERIREQSPSKNTE